MAFMNTPVTHGSGVMIVTTTGGDTQVGRIAHMLSATKAEETPLTRQLNSMTLWIVAVALVTMVIMFALGIARDESINSIFITAIALAIAAVPEALPTVTETILSMGCGRPGQAERHHQGPQLGRDPGLHLGHQHRQDRHADPQPDDRRRTHRRS